MKRTFLLLVLVLTMAAAGSVFGTPLRLDYGVADLGGGLFDYEFKLVLDNHDNSWAAGQGWGWIIFGDAAVAPSPLANFSGDASDLQIAPFTGFGFSVGGHNGPNLASVLESWTPSAFGETLSWSGTSTADLGQGELLFSTLVWKGGAVPASFEPGMRLTPGQVPEAATLLLIGIGLIALVGFGRRKLKKTVNDA